MMEANKFFMTNIYNILWVETVRSNGENILLLKSSFSANFEDNKLTINKDDIICEKNQPELIFISSNKRIYPPIISLSTQALEFENDEDAKLYFELNI